MEPLTAVAGTATATVIKRAVEDAYDFVMEKYHLVRDLGKFKKNYVSYCEKVLYVRTLASQDKSVFIEDVYVPLTIEGMNTISIEVSDYTTLDTSRAILITGLAGQGKSTLLRKLLANNAKAKNRLPMFYELKNYRGGAIEAAISLNMKNFGVDLEQQHIESLLDDSNVKLYLDAFDEAPPEYRSTLLDEIGRLVNRYNCHLVCTTRPDTELNSLAHAEMYRVAQLSNKQVVEIIHKTSVDEDKASELCDALERSPFHKNGESILRSPILVVLFCISYNLGEEIPSTLSQFYANIFDTVFYRHDNLKGKVNRFRHWNDNRRIYRALFDYFCFITQRTGVSGFSRDKFTSYVADALAYMNEDDSLADKLADELTSITNLIIQDGFNEYRFVHKSIQEFFSSSFVCGLPAEKKTGFYRRCKEDADFRALFSNTIFFLEEVDYYDYAEHYLIPAVGELLGISNVPLEESFRPSQGLIDAFLDEFILRVRNQKIYDKKMKIMSVEREAYPLVLDDRKRTWEKNRLLSFAASRIQSRLSGGDAIDVVSKVGRSLGDGNFEARVRDLISPLSISVDDIGMAILVGVAVMHKEKYNKALQRVANRTTQISTQGYLDF